MDFPVVCFIDRASRAYVGYPKITGELGMIMLGVSKDKRPTVNFLNEGEITTQNQSASACMQLIKSLTPTVAMPDIISDMA